VLLDGTGLVGSHFTNDGGGSDGAVPSHDSFVPMENPNLDLPNRKERTPDGRRGFRLVSRRCWRSQRSVSCYHLGWSSLTRPGSEPPR